MGIFDKIRSFVTGENPQQISPMEAMMMQAPQTINFAPSPADFPESFYRHQTDIRKVNSHEDMIAWIESARLHRQCKDGLKSLAANLYDDNVILSYHSQRIEADIAYLKARVYLMSGAKLCALKSDVCNPVFHAIVNQLFYQLELRFTRTIGTDRERVAQGKVTQSHEISQNMRPPLQPSAGGERR